MASERARAGFLFGVVVRALLLTVLSTALLQPAGAHAVLRHCARDRTVWAQWWWPTSREFVAHESRATERFLEALSASALETPVQRSAIPASLRLAYDRTLQQLRQDRQRRGPARRASAGTAPIPVPAGLMVLRADGSIDLVNRRAHRLLGEAAPRLAELPSLGTEAVAQLGVLPPGTHRIVQLANGTRLLAAASQFTTPGDAPQRLVSPATTGWRP